MQQSASVPVSVTDFLDRSGQIPRRVRPFGSSCSTGGGGGWGAVFSSDLKREVGPGAGRGKGACRGPWSSPIPLFPKGTWPQVCLGQAGHSTWVWACRQDFTKSPGDFENAFIKAGDRKNNRRTQAGQLWAPRNMMGR